MASTKQKQKRLRRGDKITYMNYTNNNKNNNDPENHNSVIAHLEPGTLES